MQDRGRKPFLTTFENEKQLKYIGFCLKRGCPRSPRDVRDSAYIDKVVIVTIQSGFKAFGLYPWDKNSDKNQQKKEKSSEKEMTKIQVRQEKLRKKEEEGKKKAKIQKEKLCIQLEKLQKKK